MKLEWNSDANDNGQLKRQFSEPSEMPIDDIVEGEINPALSVATLGALQTIVTLRHDLALESGETDEPTYANPQCSSLRQISAALKMKYGRTESLNERIEILELIENSELALSYRHSEFALEEAEKLLSANAALTAFQRLRLEWLPGIDLIDSDSLVLELLPDVRTAFDIDTLSLIKDFCTPRNREAIIDKFIAIFNNVLSTATRGGVGATELATLLTAAAAWNADPALRNLTAQLTNKAKAALDARAEMRHQSASTSLTRPILLVNQIAAAIYSRLAALASQPADIPA